MLNTKQTQRFYYISLTIFNPQYLHYFVIRILSESGVAQIVQLLIYQTLFEMKNTSTYLNRVKTSG